MQAENADSAGLNRFPIWPATFTRSAAHTQYSTVAVNVRTCIYIDRRAYVHRYYTAQGSRSPLSPTEVTESATVRIFLILSALLCSVNNTDLMTATWLLYILSATSLTLAP